MAAENTSILEDVRNAVTIYSGSSEVFDEQLIQYINTAFSILTQMGVGPEEGFSISDSSSKWKDFTGENLKMEMVRTAVTNRVKLLFDPPSNSFTLESLEKVTKELEYRLYLENSYPTGDENVLGG